ncbi:MAG: cell division protein ZapA [Aquabacterium sp.]|nr:cell division protein ZapA [Aquabacterium sp.]
MKQIEATILGQSYMLACPPDGETLLREAVAIVDREMSAIRNAGKVKARERIAVLTALNLAYQRAEQAHVVADTSAPVPAPAPAPALAVADGEIDVEHLIHRIDGVLGQDGQLL